MQSEAFDLEYLGRVADVKDTVHKASLMLHLVELVVEKFPESSDLYSDLPHIHRVAKVRMCTNLDFSDFFLCQIHFAKIIITYIFLLFLL